MPPCCLAKSRLIRVKPGEIFILCSDGLCGFADDDEIFSVADKARADMNRLVDDLIQMANDRGGSDNVTVIAFEMPEVAPSQAPVVEVFTLPGESPELLKAEDEWLAKITAFEAEQSASKPESPAANPANKLVLGIIFAAFVILAVLVIYLSSGK